MSVTFRSRHSPLAVPLPPAWVNAALIGTHTYLAVGYLGPDRLRSAPSYVYIHAVADDSVWGLALVAGAVLSLVSPFLRRWPATIVRSMAAAPLVAIALLLGAAQVAGLSTGWGATGLLLWPIAGHLLLIAARHHPETRRA